METKKYDFYSCSFGFEVLKQNKMREIHTMGIAITATTSSIDLPPDLPIWVGLVLGLGLGLGLG